MRKYLLTISLGASLAACGRQGTDEAASYGSALPPDPDTIADVDFATLKQYVLTPHCISCHHDWTDETEFQDEIEIGDPANSDAYQAVRNGSMPKNQASLSSRKIELLRRYIIDVGGDFSPIVSPSTPIKMNGPTSDEDIDVGSFKYFKENLIDQSCVQCHKLDPEKAEEDQMILFNTEADLRRNKDEVIKLLEAGKMPPPKKAARLGIPIPSPKMIELLKNFLKE